MHQLTRNAWPIECPLELAFLTRILSLFMAACFHFVAMCPYLGKFCQTTIYDWHEAVQFVPQACRVWCAVRVVISICIRLQTGRHLEGAIFTHPVISCINFGFVGGPIPLAPDPLGSPDMEYDPSRHQRPGDRRDGGKQTENCAVEFCVSVLEMRVPSYQRRVLP